MNKWTNCKTKLQALNKINKKSRPEQTKNQIERIGGRQNEAQKLLLQLWDRNQISEGFHVFLLVLD